VAGRWTEISPARASRNSNKVSLVFHSGNDESRAAAAAALPPFPRLGLNPSRSTVLHVFRVIRKYYRYAIRLAASR